MNTTWNSPYGAVMAYDVGSGAPLPVSPPTDRWHHLPLAGNVPASEAAPEAVKRPTVGGQRVTMSVHADGNANDAGTGPEGRRNPPRPFLRDDLWPVLVVWLMGFACGVLMGGTP